MTWPFAAVAQFCASSVITRNAAICSELVDRAASQGAKAVFFPEASDFIAESAAESIQLTTSLGDSSFVKSLQDSARDKRIWVSVGVHEKSPSPTHIYNSHLTIDADGDIVSVYRKIHLFKVDIKNGPRLMESDSTFAGNTIPDPVATPIGKVGQQTCYDLRFAELSIAQRRRGADILTFPSAFTVKTGMAHWEPLLRARAIETQSYVIAAAQIGQHNAKRTSYGNAMIVDPWGTILARCGDGISPSIAIAPIDLDYLKKVRTEMPVMNHRRTDVYPKIH
ncbi:nitrilase, putative [Zychaea mexicana]|uniref:nitrilase, putative n=1 Tax=Zychaea mexicana TaxID=64656 RepID=UPI0022FDF1B1|nr:nitrilase, putative [Zychaea mexicana]KAI9489102.1 nitrilase, putative [Zychaea mexicana]